MIPTTKFDTPEIRDLVTDLVYKKEIERQAQAARLDAESALYSALGLSPTDVGTVTAIGDGAEIKVSCSMGQKWDQDQLSALAAEIPPAMFPFKTEFKPDAARVKYLRANEPETWSRLSPALTETPRKPSFTIKEIKQ